MTGVPGQAAIDGEVRAGSPGVRFPLELSASVQRLAEVSADALTWSGTVLPPVKLMGRRVVPVAELVPEVHAERLCFGSGPVLDRTEISTWVWPEMEGRVPPPAARITGMLAPARHWRSALAAVVPFARFTNAAIVLPRAAAQSEDCVTNCLFRARQFGVAVLSADADGVQVELPGRCYEDAPPVEETAVSRWVNEVVYESLLANEARAPVRG